GVVRGRRGGIAGVISVVGGKITADRAIAEEVVEAVSGKLERRGRSSTSEQPLPGARAGNFAVSEQELSLEPATITRLARVYGGRARGVLDLAMADRSLAQPLCPHHHGL